MTVTYNITDKKNILTPIKYIDELCLEFKTLFSKKLEHFTSSKILTDYIALKFVHKGTIALLSTEPNVELSIINSNLARYDLSNNIAFLEQDTPILWKDTFIENKYDIMYSAKMNSFGFNSGVFLRYKQHNNYYLVSFATTKEHPDLDNFYLHNLSYLELIAKYVIEISYPMLDEIFNRLNKSNTEVNNLKLVVNNIRG